ncbi:unnamed protein product [Phytophthora fragariaefolia]|uniref:Unnamed protein product n=1 Tax=Phytophthora fragariaefolia TaxID=1490495 RepID=A0A9W6Y198_9STRA|nr:unnamed protein product [Phytophthora fragariaefolia]
MGKTFDNFCLKRDSGGFVSKAAPCTKADPRKILGYLYKSICSESDYQDAALICLLWYLFGRASDLLMIRKQNISIDAAGVFFLRLVRVKTSEEQGLSLFPDADFATCPLLAVGLALVVQAAPSPALIDNLPDHAQLTSVTLSLDVLLVKLSNARPETTGVLAPAAAPRVDTTPMIYSHANRVLDRVALAVGVVITLTSHSFRRGGAQRANCRDGMTARWIFDRGAWNLTTTKKGFNYIFNTSREDHKIAKVLSGYKSKAEVKPQNLSSFDSQTLESIQGVQRILFATCYKRKTESFNICKKVLDVLTVCVLRYYPLLKNLSPESPVIKRVETCVIHGGCSVDDLLAWSIHLAEAPVSCENSTQHDTQPCNPEQKPSEPSYEQIVNDHQAAAIKHLIENSKLQNTRMDLLEARMTGDSVPSVSDS